MTSSGKWVSMAMLCTVEQWVACLPSTLRHMGVGWAQGSACLWSCCRVDHRSVGIFPQLHHVAWLNAVPCLPPPVLCCLYLL